MQALVVGGQSFQIKSVNAVERSFSYFHFRDCACLQVKSHAQKEFNKWKAHAELKHFIPPRAGTAGADEHEILAAAVFGRSGNREMTLETLERDPLLPVDLDVTDEDTMDVFADWICTFGASIFVNAYSFF